MSPYQLPPRFRRQLGTLPQTHSTGGSHRQQVIPGWSQPMVPSAPHAWESPTALSQLQLLQVSPAGANFHFNIQFHWEFDGVFHLMFHNLSNLGGNIRHQTHTISMLWVSVSSWGRQTPGILSWIYLHWLTTNRNAAKSWLVLMNGETVKSQWDFRQHRAVTGSAVFKTMQKRGQD